MKTLPLLCCLLLTTAHAGNTLPIKTEYGAKSPVPAGAVVSLKLPEKVKLGDTIPGTFTVKNTGAEPFDIYLPVLTREAAAGNADAVTGIGVIPGTAAFEALLHLLGNPSPDVVKAAGNALKLRLPSSPSPHPSVTTSSKKP